MEALTTTTAQQSYALTKVQVTMHTISRDSLDDQWYMNTGATSHMTTNEGNHTSYSNMSNNIIVVSGYNISVIGCGNALVPNPNHFLTLNNVLHAPTLI